MTAIATASSVLAETADLAPEVDRPNIVVIMVDDMSAEIAHYMAAVRNLRLDSVSFSNYFVSNSLCCPSRATFMSGKYPHNSRVRGNYWPKGGFGRFYQHNLETSVGPYLTQAGYRTGLIGKFLNEYYPHGDDDGVPPPDYPPLYVPPGWTEWFSTGAGYQSFRYDAVDSVDGVTRVVEYTGSDEQNYITDVMSVRAADFIDRAVGGEGSAPFFLVLTPFAVHSAPAGYDPQQPYGPRFPPAPRDRPDSPYRPINWGLPDFEDGDCGQPKGGGCDGVDFPDPRWGSFNQTITDPPNHAPTKPLPPEELERFRIAHLERVQAAQAVNDLIVVVRDKLEEAGVADDTYLVFTTDNGFHLGEHALKPGKGTAYDHDVRVPLVIHPPGGTLARKQPEIVQNTDLLPTFLDIAGATVPGDVDGMSLQPLIEGTSTADWRTTAFIEYAGFQGQPSSFEQDPDVESRAQHVPPYVALRTKHFLYVDYSSLDRTPPRPGLAEYFDLDQDRFMLHNLYRGLSAERRVVLNRRARHYAACAGAECWDEGVHRAATAR